MIPRPAQYLLRFDDLCPTMDRARWLRFVPLLEEFAIKPILAVVPDNQDHGLDLAPSDPEFWAAMRGLEAAGAAIGLHGYQHVCQARGRSLVPFHRETEFAGVPEPTQREWIRAGLGILRSHGLEPRLFVAPRHGLDRATLRVLADEGIPLLSDGLALRPFMRGGVTWIPQQLWAPVWKPTGLWTVCIHPNTASDALAAELGDFLRRHAAQFTSVEQIAAAPAPAPLGLIEGLWETAALLRIRARRIFR